MSYTSNDTLLERAAEVCAYFEGTDLETAIKNNLEINDLKIVEKLVTDAEAEIARQEFYNNDIIGDSRVY